MLFFPVTKENIIYVSLGVGELKKTSMSKSRVDFRAFPAVVVCPADQDSAAVV